MNWKGSKNRSDKDVLGAFKVFYLLKYIHAYYYHNVFYFEIMSFKACKTYFQNLQTAENHLSQCIESLKYEPSHCAEGKLVERAREEHKLLLEYIGDLEKESNLS